MEEANLIQFAQGKQFEKTNGPARLYSSCPGALRSQSADLFPCFSGREHVLDEIGLSREEGRDLLFPSELLRVVDRDSLRPTLSCH